MLEKSGLSANPICYQDAKEMIKFLMEDQNESSKFLILLDLSMPEMDGWEFLEAIKSSSLADRVFVVIVTSSFLFSDKAKAMKYTNVLDYFEKPINAKSCYRIKSIPEIAPYFQN